MNLQQQLVQYRRELHRFPELSMQEYDTTQRIKKWLSDVGIPILDLPLETGVVAEVRGRLPGATIALRADIDALPIDEQSGVEFSSEKPGVMHACGHDFHTAAMLGAAILLQQQKEELRGTVRFLFQPAEETAAGAKWLTEQGAMNGVQAVFGFHNRPNLSVGVIGVREGTLMAGVDHFEITITGTSGHAGMPEKCIDPIVIGSQIVMALQTIVSRRISSLDNVVISITRFSAGNTWNVIPGKAHLGGTVRTFQNDTRKKIPELIKSLVDNIAAANGATVKFEWTECLPMVNNSPLFTSIMKQAAEEEGLQVVEAERSLGGEDFAYYQEMVPGFFVWIGVEGEQEWHHPAYRLSEEALDISARYWARLSRMVLDRWT
ncbi:MAG: hydrolase [Firmicutes bacterium]|nr:hydrolase [Bacillota bacterium]